MIAAYQRADALLKHAHYLGAPLHQFAIEITDKEGLELLEETAKEWRSVSERYNMDLFLRDYELAKATHNPWPILKHMTCRGLEIQRRESTVQ